MQFSSKADCLSKAAPATSHVDPAEFSDLTCDELRNRIKDMAMNDEKKNLPRKKANLLALLCKLESSRRGSLCSPRKSDG